jgi:hypothetical protein
MTCGIYKLSFQGIDKVYIGQSSNIENRLKQHIRKLLKNTHYNPKMQEAYLINCTLPILKILEEVKDASLMSTREIYWIDYFNSYHQGLNSTIGGTSLGLGAEHPSAKYTEDDYCAVVSFLALTDMTLLSISNELDIPLSIITAISSGSTHGYLENIMPTEYAQMRSKVGHRKVGPRVGYPPLRGPDGTIYTVTNLLDFAKEHNLGKGNAGLSDLISGSVIAVKGFCLASRKIIRLISEVGEIVNVPIEKDKREFRTKYSLGVEGLRHLLNGTITTHKGWRIYNE